MGFVGGWITGWAAFNDHVRDLFGSDPERISGFIFIGTAGKELKERPRPELGAICLNGVTLEKNAVVLRAKTRSAARIALQLPKAPHQVRSTNKLVAFATKSKENCTFSLPASLYYGSDALCKTQVNQSI